VNLIVLSLRGEFLLYGLMDLVMDLLCLFGEECLLFWDWFRCSDCCRGRNGSWAGSLGHREVSGVFINVL
jgi:hypothetical protein